MLSQTDRHVSSQHSFCVTSQTLFPVCSIRNPLACCRGSARMSGCTLLLPSRAHLAFNLAAVVFLCTFGSKTPVKCGLKLALPSLQPLLLWLGLCSFVLYNAVRDCSSAAPLTPCAGELVKLKAGNHINHIVRQRVADLLTHKMTKVGNGAAGV